MATHELFNCRLSHQLSVEWDISPQPHSELRLVVAYGSNGAVWLFGQKGHMRDTGHRPGNSGSAAGHTTVSYASPSGRRRFYLRARISPLSMNQRGHCSATRRVSKRIRLSHACFEASATRQTELQKQGHSSSLISTNTHAQQAPSRLNSHDRTCTGTTTRINCFVRTNAGTEGGVYKRPGLSGL